MNRPPAGPLDGAARTRPAGWLPHPLTTYPTAATEQAHDLLTRHHTAPFAAPVRCLAARYRSATFAVGAPPALILKRHAGSTAYLGETLAYQLLDGQALVPELREASDDALTLLTEYLPHPAALTRPRDWDELIGAVAGIHTASAVWDQAVSDAASIWTVRALLEAPVPDWITHPGQWQRALDAVASAHGDQHVPLGCLDLKPDHTRRDTTGRLKIVDVETLRPDLTGLWDLIILAHLANTHAAELMTLSGELQAAGIQLELLTGPLTGIYDPNGMGAMLFAVLAVAAQLDREYIRDKTMEGQQVAAANGHHGGRPQVIDDDMLTFAFGPARQRDAGPADRRQAADQLGQDAGRPPSIATLVTAPSEAARRARQAARLEAAMNAAVDQVTTALPKLGPQEATVALETAVPITVKGPARFLEELAAHMAAHPDALTSGDSLCPPVLLRQSRAVSDLPRTGNRCPSGSWGSGRSSGC